MKSTITIENQALQYLYILVNYIKSKDIASIRKVNRIYETIEPLVIEFEKEGRKLSEEGKKIGGMYKFAREQHENKLNSGGYEVAEEQTKAEELLAKAEKDLEEINEQLDALNKTQIQASFEVEAFAFLIQSLNVVLANFKQEGEEGINGRKDLILIEKIFDSLEAVSKK